MRRDLLAERLLSLVGPPERAASAVGDLIEEAGERGRVWFWRSVARLWLSMLGRDLVRSPFAMAACSAFAWFLYMGLSLVLAFAGYVVVTLVWGGAHVLANHTGFELLANVLSDPLRLAADSGWRHLGDPGRGAVRDRAVSDGPRQRAILARTRSEPGDCDAADLDRDGGVRPVRPRRHQARAPSMMPVVVLFVLLGALAERLRATPASS